MDTNLASALKEKNAKLLVVDSDLEKKIKELMDLLDTSALDVVAAATTLMAQAIGKQVILRDPHADFDIVINSLLDKMKKNKK